MAAALYTSPARCANPTMAVMPEVARATSSMAAWFWSRNSGRKRRSSGGYPVSVSSGNATRSAPRSRAWAIVSMTFLAFPGRSPTVGFIWASASRTIRSDWAPAAESLRDFTATMVSRRARRFHRFQSGPKGCLDGAIRHEGRSDGERDRDRGSAEDRVEPARGVSRGPGRPDARAHRVHRFITLARGESGGRSGPGLLHRSHPHLRLPARRDSGLRRLLAASGPRDARLPAMERHPRGAGLGVPLP